MSAAAPMSHLVVLMDDGEVRASTETIAKGVKVHHKNALALVNKHRVHIEVFGVIAFETRLNKRGKATEYAMLNEQQSALLISLMRNSPEVIGFKVSLIRDFFRMRNALQQREKGLWQQLQALIAQETESKVKATYGSRLMLDRKREIPFFKTEHQRLESEFQPPLFN